MKIKLIIMSLLLFFNQISVALTDTIQKASESECIAAIVTGLYTTDKDRYAHCMMSTDVTYYTLTVLQIITFIVFFVLVFFCIQKLFKLQNKMNHNTKIVISIMITVLISALTAPTIEIKLDKKTYRVSVFYYTLSSIYLKNEKMSDSYYNESKFYNKNIVSVKNDYLQKQAFDTITFLNEEQSKPDAKDILNVNYRNDSDLYIAEIQTKDKIFTLNYNKNFDSYLLAKTFNVDFEKKEKEYVYSVFNEIINQSNEVSNFIVSRFRNNVSINPERKDYLVALQSDKKIDEVFNDNINLCKSLTDINVFDISSISDIELYKYKNFASFCISNNVYNKFKSKNKLLFSDDINNFKSDYLLNSVSRFCTTENFAICSEILKYANVVKNDQNLNKLGKFKNAAHKFNISSIDLEINIVDLMSKFKTETDEFYIDSKKVIDKNYQLDSKIRNKNLNSNSEIYNELQYEYFSNVNNFKAEDYLNIVLKSLNEATLRSAKRFKTCTKNPNSNVYFKEYDITFICETPSKESLNFSKSLANIGYLLKAQIFIDNHLSNKKIKNSVSNSNLAKIMNLSPNQLKTLTFSVGLTGQNIDVTGAGSNSINTSLAFSTALSILAQNDLTRETILNFADSLIYYYYYNELLYFVVDFIFILLFCYSVSNILIKFTTFAMQIKARSEFSVIVDKLVSVLYSTLITTMIYVCYLNVEILKEKLYLFVYSNVYVEYSNELSMSNLINFVLNNYAKTTLIAMSIGSLAYLIMKIPFESSQEVSNIEEAKSEIKQNYANKSNVKKMMSNKIV